MKFGPGFGTQKQTFERFSQLENLLDKIFFDKLQNQIDNQLKHYHQLISWQNNNIFKFDDDLTEEIDKIEDTNIKLLSDCLVMVSLLTHISTKFSRLKETNMEDDYTNNLMITNQTLKNQFMSHILPKYTIENDFEKILDIGKNLLRDLRNYEIVKSQKAILNDWMDNDNLLEKALLLDKKIQDFVEKMDSTDISEPQKR